MKENTSKKVTRAKSNVKTIFRKVSEREILTFWRQRQNDGFHVRAKTSLPVAVAVAK